LVIAHSFVPPYGFMIARTRDALDLAIFAAVSIGISAAVGQLRSMLSRERATALQAKEAKLSTDATWSMVAHDLRTPLNVITLGSSALGGKPSMTPEMEKMLGMIKRSTVRASVLLDDALDAMRAAEGKLRVEPAECDPRELCAHAVDSVSILAARQGVTLECDVSTTQAALCDQPRLEQVLTNLLGNAIKFTPPGGVVSLYVDEEDDGLHFAVRDNGRGIPPEELDAIFTKFWTGSAQSGTGRGLGLWIACAILEAHHSRLAVESRVGQGTTFQFTLAKAAAGGSRSSSQAS
jgi:signal transduction histidine kinase